MTYLLTFLWCLPSPILWIFSAEAWVVGHAAVGVDFPLVLALAATVSQSVTFSLLFWGGDAVLRRFPRLRAYVERVDVSRYRGAGYSALGVAAVIGLPPLTLLALVARAFNYRFGFFLALCLVGRLGRFGALALAPDTFRQIFGASPGA
jgi:membrane protein YqaA with SNARE-associated domain